MQIMAFIGCWLFLGILLGIYCMVVNCILMFYVSVLVFFTKNQIPEQINKEIEYCILFCTHSMDISWIMNTILKKKISLPAKKYLLLAFASSLLCLAGY